MMMKIIAMGAMLALPLGLGGCVEGNTEGTYRGQTGYDPDTANMSMCSDGALREDCRNAPAGY
ncbi:hypothetical protein [Pseudorhodobacter sp.]|uniref:hypothetical protein n=1 Tax=Pseudorhodobacter sp. TaxID=1934400 RepID=UPI00264A4341|nr:hypothetical protein [Pseudorhodobacter sp.]MDN5787982.1 hypothetical protein [Pseudorhodobacter sp.]